MGDEPVRVTLEPMTAAQFEAWLEGSIRSFAEDLANATGQPLRDTSARARQQFAEWLPAGVATENTWLMTIVDATGAEVGALWLGPHPQRAEVAFGYDIEINPEHRGRGLGRAAMLAAEQLARQAGFTELALNVFGFNDPARRLYDSLGYRVVSTQMTKRLEPDRSVSPGPGWRTSRRSPRRRARRCARCTSPSARVQPLATSSPCRAAMPRSAASSRSASSSESPAATTVVAAGAPRDLGHRGALGQRPRHPVELAALQRQRQPRSAAQAAASARKPGGIRLRCSTA